MKQLILSSGAHCALRKTVVAAATLFSGIFFANRFMTAEEPHEGSVQNISHAKLADVDKAAEAPEFVGIEKWIQSEPLKLADQRGKVVVVHFWTNGCINCQHNYPQYRALAKRYGDKQHKDRVLIVGVHTPEFESEGQLDRIRDQAKKNDLAFPIAADTQSETWKAWHNRYWPAIYVVDKHGRIRYEWAGELTSAGRRGDEILNDAIDRLLAEK